MTVAPLAVLMPVKNVGPYIDEAISSILQQSFTDFEFVIVDDHSEDNTWQRLQYWANKDSRIQLHPAEARGVAACLNQGLDVIQSPFVARMDGDDIAVPERFETQMQLLSDRPDVDVCGSWIRLFGAKEEVWHYREHDEQIKNLMLFKRSGFGHNAVILRREVYQKFRYEHAFDFCEDYRLWCKIAGNSDYKFYNIQRALVDYRIHTEQVIATRQEIQAKLRARILFDFIRDLGVECNDREFALYQNVRDGKVLSHAQDIQTFCRFWRALSRLSAVRFPDKYNVIEQYMPDYLLPHLKVELA